MQDGFTLNQFSGLKYFTCNALSETGLVSHCFPTRSGGVSSSDGTQSLNLSFKKEKNSVNVIENFRRLCSSAGILYDKLIVPSQMHGDTIFEPCQEDVINENKLFSFEGDASITDKTSLALCCMHADCIPLLLLAKDQLFIAAVHSGWRGTLKKISVRTVDTLKSKKCNPQNIIAAVGPSICTKHFQVDRDVAELFIPEYGENFVFYDEFNEKYNVNLTGILETQLISCGIPKENVHMLKLCTFCEEELFFSHRRQRGVCGTHASIIQLL